MGRRNFRLQPAAEGSPSRVRCERHVFHSPFPIGRCADIAGARDLFAGWLWNGVWRAFGETTEFATFSCDGLRVHRSRLSGAQRTAMELRADPQWRRPRAVQTWSFGKGGVRPLARSPRYPHGQRADRGRPSACSNGTRAVSAIEDATLAHVVARRRLTPRGVCLGRRAAALPGRFKRVSLSADQMPGLYSSRQMSFCTFALLERLGNVFLEAWASGLPIVGHDSERLRWNTRIAASLVRHYRSPRAAERPGARFCRRSRLFRRRRRALLMAGYRLLLPAVHRPHRGEPLERLPFLGVRIRTS